MAEHMNDVLSNYPMNLFSVLFDGEFPVLPGEAEASLEYILHLMRRQSNRSIDILMYRFRDGKTYEEIAKIYGVTRERIRQVEQNAIRQLKHPARRDWIEYGVSGMIDRKCAEEYERGRKIGVVEGMDYAVEPDWIDAQKVERPTSLRLCDLDLSARSHNCLARAGVQTVEDILKMGFDTLVRVRNLGKKSLDEIIIRLQEAGFDTTTIEKEKKV